MLKLNFLTLAAACLIFPTGAYATQLNSERNTQELNPAIALTRSLQIEQKLAHYYQPPRPRRYKRRYKPRRVRGITIVL